MCSLVGERRRVRCRESALQRKCVADPLHLLREPATDRERTESLRQHERACSSHRERGRGFTKVEEAEEEEDEEEDEEEERLFKANRKTSVQS